MEDWLANGSRRADVIVTFADGRQLAIELQSQLLPDPDWLAGRRSYAARDITDVSLWHPRIRYLPRILLREGLPNWRLDVDAARRASATRRRTAVTPTFIRVADSPFDDNNRLLAYLAPDYTDGERREIPKAAAHVQP